jgi:lysozyme
MCELIKKYEGYSSKAYVCPKGVLTIGYGNTTWEDGTPIKFGDTIDRKRAEKLLTEYIKKEVDPVFKKIPYSLTDAQKDALRSLIYNWNLSGFLKSKLYKAICNKDLAEVCRQWDYGFKNNLLGLFKRRTEELYMFIRDL